RSPDGWMGRFRHGASRLCIDFGIPAVPIALRGTYAAMPRGRSWPIRGRPAVSVRFGPPIEVSEGEDFRQVSKRLQQAMARLWDEDETDWYRSLRHEEDGSTPSLTGPDAPRWRRIWEASRPVERRRPGRVWRR